MRRWTMGGLGAFLAVGLLAAGLAASPAASAAGHGTWAGTGSMTKPRLNPTTVLLHNGQVLVMGAGTAELYDPGTGTFSATGAMTTDVYNFTATVLQDGQVLVAGGAVGGPGGTATSSAELFDPATGTFSPTGSMTTARTDLTATLLDNGKVLVAGGEGTCATACTGFSSAELYDPATGTWTPTGSMSGPRAFHIAALLPGGKVLVAGGTDGITDLSSAELYDPAAGTFSPTGSMTTGLSGNQLSGLLPSGKVLVQGDHFSTQPELYDPATGTWTGAGTGGGSASSDYNAVLLGNGQVLAAGGANGAAPGKVTFSARATLWDPATNTSTVTGSMTIPRVLESLTLLQNGQVLAAGGDTENSAGQKSITATAELYTP